MKIKEGLFTSPAIYRPSWLYRLSPLLVSAGVMALLWVITLCQATSSSAKGVGAASFILLIISLCILPLGALLCLVTVNTFILTAPEGLLYSSSGTCVYTPWRNVGEVESKLMGSFKVENLRLRREAVSGLSLEEGIQQRIAVVTKTTAVRATEEALPVLRGVVLILSIVSILGGGRSHARVSTSSNPPIQQYIPVGLFGSHWKYGQLGSDVYRYRNMDAQQGKELGSR
jgi:hypothetical protein